MLRLWAVGRKSSPSSAQPPLSAPLSVTVATIRGPGVAYTPAVPRKRYRVPRSIPKSVRARWAGIIATAAVVILGWGVWPGFGQHLDGVLYDRAVRALPASSPTSLSIVAIDGPSTARVGPWPWPDDILARLVESLTARGARVIAFATTLPWSGAGSPLTTAMFTHGSVVIAAGEVDPTAPAPSQQAGHLGHLILTREADGVVRSMPAQVPWQDATVSALPLVVAARALDLHPSAIVEQSSRRLRLGTLELPLDRGALRPRLLLDRAVDIEEVPAWQVLESDMTERDLADRIVVIGHAGERVATPVSQSQPVAQIAAAVVASVLSESMIAHPLWARILEWVAALAAVALAGIVLPRLGPWRSLAAVAIAAGALFAAELALLTVADTWIALAVPAAALFAGWGASRAAFLDVTRSEASGAITDQTDSMRLLAQTFRSQGRLELAFETLRQCPADRSTLEGLYAIGLEFERNGQPQEAANIFAHIASIDPAFRDAAARVVVDRAVDTHGVKPSEETSSSDTLPFDEPAAPEPEVLRLGRYEIERELGKGAMGVVYLGRDPRINRVVAIKAIALADEFEEADLAEAKARFFREAEMAGRLNHPGIVTIYDVGEDGRLAFIAMELLRGAHLSHHTEPDNLLPPDQVLELIARVADALQYAHQQNVVHRDIKPANIMFNGATDELKITDFGIARLTDTSRTKTGIVLGTPSFMSPEQLEGRRLDGRSDLFSLGVSLYQLLTGELPFRAESMNRLMQKIATEAHTPARALRPELPDSVESVIEKALAKNPDDRFQTGSEFASALRDCAARVAA